MTSSSSHLRNPTHHLPPGRLLLGSLPAGTLPEDTTKETLSRIRLNPAWQALNSISIVAALTVVITWKRCLLSFAHGICRCSECVFRLLFRVSEKRYLPVDLGARDPVNPKVLLGGWEVRFRGGRMESRATLMWMFPQRRD